ncbi:DUF6538 domain-containing protein [Pseudomonas sp. NPDC089743]|uniref:DUF6538 domain-containing protein n=1 Tax=Pseudomonas sp. NPDC089743 TaxID=3364471 RepID=UPI003827E5E0
MKASFDPLQVNLRYTYSRKGTLDYQRPIPKELQPRYGKKLVKVKLKSADVLLASREVDRLNRQVEAEWERLRAEPTSSPQALRAHAVSLLRDWVSPISLRRMTPLSSRCSSTSWMANGQIMQWRMKINARNPTPFKSCANGF